MTAGPEIETLIRLFSRLPGLGPRSARRIVLYLLKRRETALTPLCGAMTHMAETVHRCSVCGNYDTVSPCTLCRDEQRDDSILCVVEDVDDLWALERTGVFSGRYHVLGGVLSALDGIGPEELRLDALLARVKTSKITEVFLALSATVDGQTTAHYIADVLQDCQVTISGLARGIPVGGELDYLDDGTLSQAIRARRPL